MRAVIGARREMRASRPWRGPPGSTSTMSGAFVAGRPKLGRTSNRPEPPKVKALALVREITTSRRGHSVAPGPATTGPGAGPSVLGVACHLGSQIAEQNVVRLPAEFLPSVVAL